MESRVLPAKDVAAILAAKFVCVKVNVDSPGPAAKILEQVQGNTLPFFAYVTPEGKFISGTSGFRDEKTFKADLEGVLQSDVLRVPAPLEKKLASMAEQAAKDAEAGKTAAVVKTARQAEAIRGSSASKDRIRELYAKALEDGRGRLEAAADLCREGKFDDAGKVVSEVSKDYKGTELEKAAAAANKALPRLRQAHKDAEAGNANAAKRAWELVVKECKDAGPFAELAEEKLK